MKVNYRGYNINVERGDSVSGEMHIFYSIVRDWDLCECISGFTSPTDKISNIIQDLKVGIDEELSRDNPWEGLA